MSHPGPDAAPPLPRAAWRLGMGEPSGFDGAGVHAIAEVQGAGFTADGHVHLLDETGLVVALTLEELRRATGFHEWLSVEGVLPVRAIEVESDRVAVISEAFGGRPLTRVVGATPIPPRAAAELVAQLAEGLHDLHTAAPPGAIKAAGLAHGGVDLDHVLVGRKGEVRVLEAGLVGPLRQRGVAVVDPAFLAPEVRADAQATPSADVYGATLVLLTCLTGRPPDPLPDEPEAHAKAVDAVLAGVFELDGQVAELLRLGLAVDPAVRPSARELSARLRADVPRLGGRWFSAWAGDALPKDPTYRPIPREVAVAEAVDGSPRQKSEPPPPAGGLRPLQKVGGQGEPLDTRRVLMTGAGAVAAGALLFLGLYFAVDPITRWWLDNHGEMDMEDVPTELQGPPRGAAGEAEVRASDGPAGGGGGTPGTVVVGPEDLEPEPEPGFALATPDRQGEALAAPKIKLETAPPPPPPAPQPVLPVPLIVEEPFGQDWEEVGEDKPILDLQIDAPFAEDLRVVCANGVTASGTDSVSLQPRKGRCDVRVVGLSGEARGSFRPENSGRVTCRVEFADQLRCRGE